MNSSGIKCEFSSINSSIKLLIVTDELLIVALSY